MASPETSTVVLRPGPLGVGIQNDGGMCVVVSKSNPATPLQVADRIVSMNGIELCKVEGGVQAWVKLFQAFSTESTIRRVVVQRVPAAAESETELIVLPTTVVDTAKDNAQVDEGASIGSKGQMPTTNDSSVTAASSPDSEKNALTSDDRTAFELATDSSKLAERNKSTSNNISASEYPAAKANNAPQMVDYKSSSANSVTPPPDIVICNSDSSELTNSNKSQTSNVSAPKGTVANANSSRQVVDSNANPANLTNNEQTVATNKSSSNLSQISDTKEGHADPLDIVAERETYPNLFREYTRLSDRHKESLKALDDAEKYPVPDSYCTEILGANFAGTLPPHAKDSKTPYTNDSMINKFGLFMWGMFAACESGTIGGDACRMTAVLMAAIEDVLDMSDDTDCIEHLLGLTCAIHGHKLWAFFDRGHSESGRIIFAEIAKKWKKFFEPKYKARYNISNAVRKFAEDACWVVQDMLKNIHKTHGEYATKYNFNYKRIPRPNRAKNTQKENADLALSNSTNTAEKRKSAENMDTATKKKKKPTEAMLLMDHINAIMDRINAVEGVPEDEVFDSCPEIREKISAFLKHDWITKSKLCVALGNINHNSLNKFLSAAGQNQSGNCTYQKAYIFFEKLRILEGNPKSNERSRNEIMMTYGFDITKDKGGGRPSYIYGR